MHKVLSAAFFALALAAAGCGAKSTPAPDPTAESASPLEARVPFLDVALASNDVALRPDQRKDLEALKASLVAKHAAVKTEMKSLGTLLADGLEKGALDDTSVDAQLAKVHGAADAAKPDFVAAMQKLHDALDASQRQALVAAMKEHKGMHHRGHGFMAVLKDLDLSSQQKDALRTAMGGHEHEGFEKAHAEMRAAFESFASDSFDAKSLEAMHAKGPAAFADKSVKFVRAAMPILDQAQRAKLAAAIRARVEKA